jgi:starch phosphorylase
MFYRSNEETNNLPRNLQPLFEIAHNLWYAWHAKVLKLFDDIDHDTWFQIGHSPVVFLKTVSQEKLHLASQDVNYVTRLNNVYQDFLKYLNEPNTWYKKNYGKAEKSIAYFCLEYGIHSSLPIYSGGLGILSGDHLKSASDLDLPLVAVGLFYAEGYFKQSLNAEGRQEETYLVYDSGNLPMLPAKNIAGEEFISQVEMGTEKVFFKVWLSKIGRISLYLLDTNIPQNPDYFRDITKNLYTGDREKRLQQEIVLGIGGVTALAEMGIEPLVSHMNEGHSATLILERISRLMKLQGLSWFEALAFVKATSVFTTHTPVPAGNEYFDPMLMYKLLKDKVEALGASWDDFIGLGRFNPTNHSENFCMTILALKSSAYANGVAKLHGKVSREMWQSLYPGVTVDDVPIGHITNGVHAKTWLSKELNTLLHSFNQNTYHYDSIECTPWKNIERVPDKDFWQMHYQMKTRLINYVRAKYALQVKNRSKNMEEKVFTDDLLSPDFLTIGFSRRFATYKRGDLILKDVQRLKRILNFTNRPIQIIFAGKSHPADQYGKMIIHNIYQFASDPENKSKVIFLEDYDIHIAKFLVQGVDVWLNNPVRPQEASGTSGMKAGMNGVLNFSVLDGWWDEAYSKNIGWEIGNGVEFQNVHEGNETESRQIYDILENEIIPLFYNRNADNLPEKWIKMMKQSVINVGSVYNTHRMVSDYYHNYYQLAELANTRLSQNNYAEIKRTRQDKIKS